MEPTLKQERALDAVEDAIQAFRDRFGGGDVFRCYGCGRTAGPNDWTDKVEFTPEQAEKHAAEVIRATFGTRHTNGFVGMVPVQVAEA